MQSLDFSILENTLCHAQQLLYKSYLATLSQCASLACCPPHSCPSKLLKIKEATCLTTADFSTFSYILNVLHSLHTTLFYMLDVTPSSITPYIGLSGYEDEETATKLLIDGLLKLYSPFECEWSDSTELFHMEQINQIASTTFLPAVTLPTSCTNPTLAPFIALTNTSTYTLILTASPVCQSCYLCEQTELQCLYTKLYPFSEITYTNHHHVTKACATTCTTSTGNTQTNTCNKSTTSGCSTTISHNVVDSTSSNVSPNDVITIIKNNNTSDNDSRTNNCSETLSDSSSNQKSCSNGSTKSDTCTDLTIHTTNYRTHNLEVAQLLEQIPLYLTRYETTRFDPIFNFNTYFISPNAADCLFAASSYMGLLATPSPNLYPRALNIWAQDHTCFHPLLETLLTLTMPSFCVPSLGTELCLGTSITSSELNAFITPLILASSLGN